MYHIPTAITLIFVGQNIRGFRGWRSDHEYFIFYPRMKRPCLPLPAVQAATTKILYTHEMSQYVEPRIFCPPKITRYTV